MAMEQNTAMEQDITVEQDTTVPLQGSLSALSLTSQPNPAPHVLRLPYEPALYHTKTLLRDEIETDINNLRHLPHFNPRENQAKSIHVGWFGGKWGLPFEDFQKLHRVARGVFGSSMPIAVESRSQFVY
ncbi:hypothetical protein BDV12DRAFT_193143 [Aspergillus spectabilis]